MKPAQLDQLFINTIRTLSIDAVQKAQSGHSGTPTAYCLWQRFLYTIQMIRTGLAEPCPFRVRVMRKTLQRATLLSKYLTLLRYGCHDCYLEVDGGVKIENIRSVAEAGADTFVAGSAIFCKGDYRETITKMRAQLTDP
jgi:pentose-5-phosphate-3-epimerase